jgi:hypothetical protein
MNGVERFFYELGSDLRDQWDDTGASTPDFAPLAADALDHYLRDCPSWRDILIHAAGAQTLPRQGRRDEGFGQPALTLFWDRRFRIDVLFWRSSSIAIHEHGFAGAFAVLAGGSLVCRYAFDDRQQIGRDFETGRLRLEDAEVLSFGSVRLIPPGRRLIHSVYHLDVPSVSIVIKTNRGLPRGEFTYQGLNVAFEPSRVPDGSWKKLQALELAVQLGRPDHYAEVALAALAGAEVLTAYLILLKTFQQVREPGVTARIEQRFRSLNLPDSERLIASAKREAHRRALVALRGTLASRHERLVLAILAAAPDRESVLRALATCVSDMDSNVLQRTVSAVLAGCAGSLAGTLLQDEVASAIARGLDVERFIEGLAHRLGPGEMEDGREQLSALYRRLSCGELSVLAS